MKEDTEDTAMAEERINRLPPVEKICFIIDSLTGGGAERLVLTLAHEMIRLGKNVHIITLYGDCNYSVTAGIVYHCLSPSGKSSEGELATELRKKCEAEEAADKPFDLIVCNLLLSSMVTRRAGIPGVYHCIHNSMGEQIRLTRSRITRVWWQRKIRNLYNGQHLICVSKGTARDLEHSVGVKPKSVHVIYNGFDLEAIRTLSKAKLPEAEALRPYVLHVGHFKRQKRLDILLQAWSQVTVEHKLVLIGNGSKRKTRQLKSLAHKLNCSDRVIFSGWHENSYAWMHQADLLVVSSDFEGFGRVIVEAMASGTPVISTNCPSGPNEILTGELEHCLVPPADARTLAKRIDSVLKNPPDIPAEVTEPFAIEQVADEYLNLPARQTILGDNT